MQKWARDLPCQIAELQTKYNQFRIDSDMLTGNILQYANMLTKAVDLLAK